MLCCGKKSKKKVKGEGASHDNGAFVKDQSIKGGDIKRGEVGDSSVVEVVTKHSVMGENSLQGSTQAEQGTSEETLKSILHNDHLDEKQRKVRRRSVSFNLPDVPILTKEQLESMFEQVDKAEEESEKAVNTLNIETIPEKVDLLELIDNGQELTLVESDISESEEETLTEGNISTMSNHIPAITKPAPIFKGTAVVDGEFKEISLSDYSGKYVVFFFYPLDFTFVCPTEIIAFSERAEEFRSIGCEVIACSTDSHFSHLAWINMPRKEGGLGTMNIPLLADKSMANARAYGVLKEDDGVAFRGLFIIDGKGNLRQATINDLPVGRDVDETLRLVQAFQFTDEHGEVCPAGWKPGSKTMKADPTGSKEYFSSEN